VLDSLYNGKRRRVIQLCSSGNR